MSTTIIETAAIETTEAAVSTNTFANIWLGMCFTLLGLTASVTAVIIAYPVIAMWAA